MSEKNKLPNFYSLGKKEQLILAWICARLSKNETIYIDLYLMKTQLFPDSHVSEDELNRMLQTSLDAAPFIKKKHDDNGLSVQLANNALSIAEEPISLFLKGEYEKFFKSSDKEFYDTNIQEPVLIATRLNEIIARATARLQEQRKKRRKYTKFDTQIMSIYNPYSYSRACKMTREGKVVLWPNEVTYGLTTNGLMELSVQRLYDAKGRVANPIPVLCCKEWIQFMGYIPKLAQDVVDAFWPDNISIVVPKRKENINDLMTAGIDSVALMCPNTGAERLAYDICDSGSEIIPIACSSANISGQKSITDSESAIEKFYGLVDVILTGPESKVGMNTTIIDFSVEPYALLRVGPVSINEVLIAVPELEGRIVDCTK